MAVAFTAARADTTRLYTARSTIYVGASTFSVENGSDSNLSADETIGLERIILTFSQLIDSEPVVQQALDVTGIPRSAPSVVGQTFVVPIQNTNILQVFVRDPDPAAAQVLSTGIAEAFVQKISELEPGQTLGEGDLPAAPATIFERARLPTVPSSKSMLPSLFVAAVFGLLAACGCVLLAEYLDITVKSADDAEARLELPVLGVIPTLSYDGPRRARAPAQERAPADA